MNEEFVASDLQVGGVDYRELGKYISMNWSEGKIMLRGLARVCPRRRHKFGPRPGLKGKEAVENATEENQQMTIH